MTKDYITHGSQIKVDPVEFQRILDSAPVVDCIGEPEPIATEPYKRTEYRLTTELSKQTHLDLNRM